MLDDLNSKRGRPKRKELNTLLVIRYKFKNSHMASHRDNTAGMVDNGNCDIEVITLYLKDGAVNRELILSKE